MIHGLAIAFLAAALGIAILSLYTGVRLYRRIHLPPRRFSCASTLVLPVSGAAAHLDRLIAGLAQQTLLPRRLIIAVESTSDPAWAQAYRLVQNSPFPIELVTGGLAERTAQKCQNQIAALARVDESDEAVVLFDADVVVPTWWLEAVVEPLMDGTADIVNGYRWQMPELALGAQLVAAIDRAFAAVPRVEFARALWGGTVGFNRHAMAVLDLPRILSNAVTDDLVIGERAGELGLRIVTRSILRIPTPTNASLVSAWEFGRRQYQLIRPYRPSLLAIAAATTLTRLAAWAFILTGLPTTEAAWIAGGALIALALLKQAVLQAVGARLGMPDGAATRAIQYGLALVQPLVDAFHLSMILGGLSRTVQWAHVTYETRGSEFHVVARRPWNSSSD